MTKSAVLPQFLSLSVVNSELLCTCKNDGPKLTEVKNVTFDCTNNRDHPPLRLQTQEPVAALFYTFTLLAFETKNIFVPFLVHHSLLFKVLSHSTREKNNI